MTKTPDDFQAFMRSLVAFDNREQDTCPKCGLQVELIDERALDKHGWVEWIARPCGCSVQFGTRKVPDVWKRGKGE